MKILITNRGFNHLTYRKMSNKPACALKELGHEVITASAIDPRIKDFNPDLTIILGYSASWDQVKNLTGKKIWWSHGANWSTHSNYKEENKQVWDLFRNCDAVAYQSEFAKHMTQKYLEFEREGPIILNAGEIQFIENPPKAQNVINVATTAVWREWKRLLETEKVIDEVNKKLEWRKFHLWVYGKSVNDKPVGDSNYIHYLGMSDDFPKYKECHFYTQLSFNDYSPATVGEAMGYGLPVVCTNSGGSKDIVGTSGLVVETDPFIDYSINVYKQLPPMDYSRVVEAFRTMVDNLDLFKSKVRDRVLSVANNKISAQQLLSLYEKITFS